MPVELNTIKPPDVNQMSATQKRIKMAMGNYPEQQTVMDAKISQQPVTDAQIAENNKIGFNSNMVRLKDCRSTEHCQCCIRFNSNMVRLKVGC